MEKDKKEKIIKFDLDGKKAGLKFSYISKGNKGVVLPNSEEGYQLTPVANSSSYILSYNDSLYELDVAAGKISKLLSDSVAGFDRESVRTSASRLYRLKKDMLSTHSRGSTRRICWLLH